MEPDDSLRQAILADPADEAVRLALADRLEDHGTPAERDPGEFIHAQCSLAGAGPPRRPDPGWIHPRLLPQRRSSGCRA